MNLLCRLGRHHYEDAPLIYTRHATLLMPKCTRCGIWSDPRLAGSAKREWQVSRIDHLVEGQPR